MIEPAEFKHYQIVDELYGTGDFDENITQTEDVDKHMASSVESLVRLFRREEEFVSKLRNHLHFKIDALIAPKYPDDMDDFLAGSALIASPKFRAKGSCTTPNPF